jgi:insertion element IS1 protein InsB
MTDHWKAYTEFLPECIHTQSKAETYTVEGYNSIIEALSRKVMTKDKMLYKES